MKLDTVLLWVVILIAIYLMYRFNLLEGQSNCTEENFCKELTSLYQSGKCDDTDSCNLCVPTQPRIFYHYLGCNKSDVRYFCSNEIISQCKSLPTHINKCSTITDSWDCTIPCAWDNAKEKCIPPCDSFTTEKECNISCMWDDVKNICIPPRNCNYFKTQSDCEEPCMWDDAKKSCDLPCTSRLKSSDCTEPCRWENDICIPPCSKEQACKIYNESCGNYKNDCNGCFSDDNIDLPKKLHAANCPSNIANDLCSHGYCPPPPPPPDPEPQGIAYCFGQQYNGGPCPTYGRYGSYVIDPNVPKGFGIQCPRCEPKECKGIKYPSGEYEQCRSKYTPICRLPPIN